MTFFLMIRSTPLAPRELPWSRRLQLTKTARVLSFFTKLGNREIAIIGTISTYNLQQSKTEFNNLRSQCWWHFWRSLVSWGEGSTLT